MTKKQKTMLWRILAAALLLLALQAAGPALFDGLGPAGRWVRLACYLADYAVIGHDILKKAVKGIRNGQVFDENFLMAVATLGALALAVYENGDYLEAIAVMLFYQVGEWFQSYAVGQEPPKHQRPDGHPAGLRQHRTGREAGAGGPGRGGHRHRHRGPARREGAHRRAPWWRAPPP